MPNQALTAYLMIILTWKSMVRKLHRALPSTQRDLEDQQSATVPTHWAT